MNFEEVTELPGSPISREQLFRMYNRYYWTANLSKGCDVLEVACGAGQGLGLVARQAKSVTAGDFSEAILQIARSHYGQRFDLKQFDAQKLPFNDESFDILVLHEALYYIPDADRFMSEARRVLRVGGRVLLTNSNKDLFDFNPSPYSTVYHGVVELKALFAKNDFAVEFFGSQPLKDASLVQKVTRPAKKFAVKFGLMPKTMRGKQLLRRIIFGKPLLMPAEIMPDMSSEETLTPLSGEMACTTHKIIYCEAQKCN